jgi:hypothetical protein
MVFYSLAPFKCVYDSSLSFLSPLLKRRSP